MTTVEVEPLVEDAEEEVGPRVQARACARTDALGVGEQHQRHDLVDEHVVDRLSQARCSLETVRMAEAGAGSHTDVGQHVHRQLVGESCSSPRVRDPGISYHQISRPSGCDSLGLYLLNSFYLLLLTDIVNMDGRFMRTPNEAHHADNAPVVAHDPTPGPEFNFVSIL